MLNRCWGEIESTESTKVLLCFASLGSATGYMNYFFLFNKVT